MTEDIKRLVEAAKTVVSMRVGERPARGWLADNEETRAALQDLADSLAPFTTKETDHG